VKDDPDAGGGGVVPRPRVLVASGDLAAARGLLEQLGALGLEVQRAEPAALSTGLGDLAAFDVLLLETADLGDGQWALVEAVRERAPMLEIVVICAAPAVDSAVAAVRAGIYAVLTSPVEAAELGAAIGGAFRRKRRGEQRIEAQDRRRRRTR
jgi:DNA-binding NtrC family response regulator